MPFTSKAQRGYMWTHHPEVAREFEKKTLDVKKLPEHARRKPREEDQRDRDG